MDILYHPICFGVLHDTLICSSLLACVHAVVGSMRPCCGWIHVSMLCMDTCVHAVDGSIASMLWMEAMLPSTAYGRMFPLLLPSTAWTHVPMLCMDTSVLRKLA